MSILIKDAAMPKSCVKCWYLHKCKVYPRYGVLDKEMAYKVYHGRLGDCPLADVKPVVRGKWISEQNCYYRCSNCGKHYTFIGNKLTYNYCPDCGAEMKEVEE